MKLAVVGACGLAVVGCTSQQVVPDVDVRFPVAERSIYVEVPGHTMMNADQLRRDYYRGRRTLSHIRPRCVTAPAAGRSCATTTDVRISAVEGAKFVDAASAPSRPQLIAWVENLGTAVTFDGIQPLAVARYALVVDTQPRVNPAILLVEFPGERAARGATARAAPYGNVFRCHNYGVRLISDADYQVCSPRYGDAGAVRAPNSFRTTTVFTSMLTWMSGSGYDDPTWFSCASGCCTSSATVALE